MFPPHDVAASVSIKDIFDTFGSSIQVINSCLPLSTIATFYISLKLLPELLPSTPKN